MYVEKPKPPSRFNFVYDEDTVTIKTSIPELPEKLQARPDEKGHNKKVTEIENQI
jgi:hypothetical protein